jgi:hypothetical protein
MDLPVLLASNSHEMASREGRSFRSRLPSFTHCQDRGDVGAFPSNCFSVCSLSHLRVTSPQDNFLSLHIISFTPQLLHLLPALSLYLSPQLSRSNLFYPLFVQFLATAHAISQSKWHHQQTSPR